MDTGEEDNLVLPSKKEVLTTTDSEKANQRIKRLKCKLEKQIAYCEILRQENELLSRQLNVSKVEVGVQTDSDSSIPLNNTFNNLGNVEGTTIADDLRQIAEESVGNTGYVYDQKTGLYYDYNSGYYYDPTNQLFYEPRSGVYLSYNSETKEYSFHSRVDQKQLQKDYQDILVQTGIQHLPPEAASLHNTKNPEQSTVAACSPVSYSTEEGEVSDSDSLVENSPAHSLDQVDKDTPSRPAAENVVLERPPQAHVEVWPPCVRLIVRQSRSLDPGSLYIITCKGGTIGKDPSLHHDIYIDEEVVSKVHCEIQYNSDNRSYFVEDKATQNGTFLNYKRLSKRKRVSGPILLKHEDCLRVGSSEFQVHIHAGRETCSRCEPGQVQAKLSHMQSEEEMLGKELDTIDPTKTSKTHDSARRHQLNKIKMKYGLKNTHYAEAARSSDHRPSKSSKYVDRANERRITVGSDNPHLRQHDVTASVDRPIETENKGAQMLAKMGWKSGEALGKGQTGITEPIKVEVRVNQQAGLGNQSNPSLSLDASHQDTRNARRWAQAQERYRKLEETELIPTCGQHSTQHDERDF